MKRFMKSRNKCPVCDKKFPTAQGRDAHYKFVHMGVDKPNKKDRNSEPYKHLIEADYSNEA